MWRQIGSPGPGSRSLGPRSPGPRFPGPRSPGPLNIASQKAAAMFIVKLKEKHQIAQTTVWWNPAGYRGSYWQDGAQVASTTHYYLNRSRCECWWCSWPCIAVWGSRDPSSIWWTPYWVPTEQVLQWKDGISGGFLHRYDTAYVYNYRFWVKNLYVEDRSLIWGL